MSCTLVDHDDCTTCTSVACALVYSVDEAL